MKRIYLIIITTVFASAVGAQTKSFDGAIETSGITVTNDGGSVLLEMALEIRQDAVTKCQSIAVIPTFSDGRQTAIFPYVLVNGKNMRKMFDRKKKFRFTELVQNPPYYVVNIDRRHRGEKINYVAGITYEPWMANASLSVNMVLSSCAGERQIYAVDISAASVAPVKEQVIIAEQVAAPVETPKTEKHVKGSVYIDFEPGSSAILPNYRRNPAEIAKIEQEMSRIKDNPDAEITGLTIKGYASPEGRYSNNEMLAYDRARAFAKYMQDMYGIPVRSSKVGAVAEDWEGLREMVVSSDIPYKSTVLMIMDGPEHYDAKESRLRRLAGGSVWRILIDDMFPQLRRVEYRVDYIIKE